MRFSGVMAITKEQRNTPQPGNADKCKDNTGQNGHIAANGLHEIKFEDTDAPPVQGADDDEQQSRTVKKAHSNNSILSQISVSRSALPVSLQFIRLDLYGNLCYTVKNAPKESEVGKMNIGSTVKSVALLSTRIFFVDKDRT